MWCALRDRHAGVAAVLAQLALPLIAQADGVAPPFASTAMLSTTASLSDRERPTKPHIRLDASGRPAYLARFSDGPRRVPQAHGAPQVRATQLGIGTTDKARTLLGSRPAAALVAAVEGSAPRDLLWPVVDGKFGRGFGFTRKLRTDLPHNGVDIGAPAGAVIRAAADGLVVYSDNGLRGFGNCVMILHKNGWVSLYAHSQRTTVQAGYEVKRGERIALVGQTGYAWGPHLHFELRDNGRLRDPERLFVGRKSDEVRGPLVALSEPTKAAPQHATRAKIASASQSSSHTASAKATQSARTPPR
jgi:murein DD-endopeptidase MepM/ murein hydrolase activator NlpD